MTSFYLDPCKERYSSLEAFSTSPNATNSIPSSVDCETYQDLLESVERHRPSDFHPNIERREESTTRNRQAYNPVGTVPHPVSDVNHPSLSRLEMTQACPKESFDGIRKIESNVETTSDLLYRSRLMTSSEASCSQDELVVNTALEWCKQFNCSVDKGLRVFTDLSNQKASEEIKNRQQASDTGRSPTITSTDVPTDCMPAGNLLTGNIASGGKPKTGSLSTGSMSNGSMSNDSMSIGRVPTNSMLSDNMPTGCMPTCSMPTGIMPTQSSHLQVTGHYACGNSEKNSFNSVIKTNCQNAFDVTSSRAPFVLKKTLPRSNNITVVQRRRGRPPGIKSEPAIPVLTQLRRFAEHQCETCLLVYKTKNQSLHHVTTSGHMNVVNRSGYACRNCGQRYHSMDSARQHVLYTCTKNVAGEEIDGTLRKQWCTECRLAFFSAASFEEHFKSVHGTIAVHHLASAQQPSEFVSDRTIGTAISSLLNIAGNKGNKGLSYPKDENGNVVDSKSTVMTPNAKRQIETPTLPFVSRIDEMSSQVTNTQHAQSAVCLPLINLKSNKRRGDTNKRLEEERSKVPPHAKRITYKNVSMTSTWFSYCSNCNADLSTKERRKAHSSMTCAVDNTRNCSRRIFAFICLFCNKQYPSRKACYLHQKSSCKQHQVASMANSSNVAETNNPYSSKTFEQTMSQNDESVLQYPTGSLSSVVSQTSGEPVSGNSSAYNMCSDDADGNNDRHLEASTDPSFVPHLKSYLNQPVAVASHHNNMSVNMLQHKDDSRDGSHTFDMLPHTPGCPREINSLGKPYGVGPPMKNVDKVYLEQNVVAKMENLNTNFKLSTKSSTGKDIHKPKKNHSHSEGSDEVDDNVSLNKLKANDLRNKKSTKKITMLETSESLNGVIVSEIAQLHRVNEKAKFTPVKKTVRLQKTVANCQISNTKELVNSSKKAVGTCSKTNVKLNRIKNDDKRVRGLKSDRFGDKYLKVKCRRMTSKDVVEALNNNLVTSPVTSPVTSHATSTVTSTVTSPVTSHATSTVTSPVTSPVTSHATRSRHNYSDKDPDMTMRRCSKKKDSSKNKNERSKSEKLQKFGKDSGISKNMNPVLCVEDISRVPHKNGKIMSLKSSAVAATSEMPFKIRSRNKPCHKTTQIMQKVSTSELKAVQHGTKLKMSKNEPLPSTKALRMSARRKDANSKGCVNHSLSSNTMLPATTVKSQHGCDGGKKTKETGTSENSNVVMEIELPVAFRTRGGFYVESFWFNKTA